MPREGDMAESLGTGCSQPGEQRSFEGRNKAQVPAGSPPPPATSWRLQLLAAARRKAADSDLGSAETWLKNRKESGKKSTLLFAVAHNEGGGTQIVNDLSAELDGKIMTQTFPQGHQQIFTCHNSDGGVCWKAVSI